MRQKIWGAKLGLVLAALLFTAGCAAMLLMSLGGAAAIGSYKWVEGTMEKDYPRPMQDCWNATLAAAKDMNLKVQSQQYNPTESTMEAVAPPDTNVKIQLVARPNQITTIKVRFGLMGNQDASAYFHRQVLRHLGLPPT
jgi:hypothetical protein